MCGKKILGHLLLPSPTRTQKSLPTSESLLWRVREAIVAAAGDKSYLLYVTVLGVAGLIQWSLV